MHRSDPFTCARPRRCGPARPWGALAVGGLSAMAVVAGCSDEPERTVAAYCERVTAELPSLVGPAIGTDDDVSALIDTYRSIAAVAPATVRPEWEKLTAALETVSTVVPSDPASLEAAQRAMLAGEPSYGDIQQYTQLECGIAIGTPPTPTNPVTATTLPPDTTTPSSDG